VRRIAIVIVLLVATLAPAGPAQGSSCSSGPLNDCLDDAIEWRANPASFSNAGATMEPGEPSQCDGATVHRSIWLKLEVLEPGGRDPFKVNLGADFWITAGAYAAASDGTLALVACQASWEDEGRHNPTLYLPCTPGAVYWIQLGGQSLADQGPISISQSRYWKFEGPTLSDPCPFKP
jgi:hypothetical protein